MHGADVVIAGGGIGGTAAALRLARTGARVTPAALLGSIRSALVRGARDRALWALNHRPGAAERAVRNLQQEDPARAADAVCAVTRIGVRS
jgi:choline dehydrogenase-like flavoprotein